ncbi:MAG TPA: hypothetical protein VNM48_00085, partial [Chloroflexota bacterium]|nr:hypothetical protein [Chloroflexota bacterium]
PLLTVLALSAALAAPQAGLACGEGIFNMGQGLRYQGFLAARPATVLVYDADRKPAADRIAVYRGLGRAGHKLTVAHSPEELAEALRQRRYDVVIAGFSKLGTIGTQLSAGAPAARVLPIVDRSQVNAPEVRGRFVLLDGASLGQYLKLISQLMKD